jgi:hypothetical protein
MLLFDFVGPWIVDADISDRLVINVDLADVLPDVSGDIVFRDHHDRCCTDDNEIFLDADVMYARIIAYVVEFDTRLFDPCLPPLSSDKNTTTMRKSRSKRFIPFLFHGEYSFWFTLRTVYRPRRSMSKTYVFGLSNFSSPRSLKTM